MALASVRSQPDTSREYETIYIVQPSVAADKLRNINDRVRKIIQDDTGQLIAVENWGKRKLAYEIRKQFKGIYLYWRYLGGSELVAEIERNLRMLDDVIRYQTVKVDEDVNPDARPGEVEEEAYAAAADIPTDEEDNYRPRTAEERASDAAAAAAEGGSEQATPAGEGGEAAEVSAEAAPAAEAETKTEAAEAPATEAAEAPATEEKEGGE